MFRNKCCLSFLFTAFVFTAVHAQQPKLVLPIGHTAKINTSHFSPDGTRIVTSSYDKTAKIWDASGGTLLANLKKHKGIVYSAEFSPKCPEDTTGGRYIVTASEDSTAKIWDSKTGQLWKDLTGHHGEVLTAQFSPNGKKVVTASGDATAIIWDVATGKPLQKLSGHIARYGINFAQFSPDGKKIITGSDDATVIIWDAETGDSLHVLHGHKTFIVCACFSPNGHTILTADRNNFVKLWDAATGNYIRDLIGHKGQVNYARFSPVTTNDPDGGKFIVTASADGTARIWDTETGNQSGAPLIHLGKVNSAVFSPDGSKVLTACTDFSFRLWNLSGKLLQQVKIHKNSLSSAEFNSNGNQIVTASADKTAKIFQVNADTSLLLYDLKGHSSMARSIQYSPDGKKMLTTYFDNGTKIWDAVTGKLLVVLKDNNLGIESALFSPDGKKIIAAYDNNNAILWDVDTGDSLNTFTGHMNLVNYARFSPDGNKIITVSQDKTARVWDVQTGKKLVTLAKHSDVIPYAEFSPKSITDTIGGKRIVTVSDDKTAIIWNTLTGTAEHVLSDHKGKVLSARFSPDGTKLVTCSWDATAIIWDVETGANLHTLKGHNYAVKSVAFSPDGTKIITAGIDSIAKVWDANTGNLLFSLKGHSDNITSISFSPDGSRMLSSSYDASAILWETATGNMLGRFKGHSTELISAQFSPITDNDPAGGGFVITLSKDNTAKVWDAKKQKELYTFFSIDSTDYLVVDKGKRYDGTEAARKLLYFTCGTEVIALNQVKDQMWIPNLAQRIMKGENIDSKTLEEINICGLTPVVEDAGISAGAYHFKITARKGGIGEIIVSVNGNPTKTYLPGNLPRNGDTYELVVAKDSLLNFFTSGAGNLVTVKANTADNLVSSRGIIVSVNAEEKENITKPNLYAVMIGVSDYQGDAIDLKYAAKDAMDISSALSIAAKRFLNTKDSNHVFMYNLTTGNGHDLLPQKKNIQKVLEEIGARSTANDILLIFFAGHGVMSGEGDTKQFYFLTSDASSFSTGDSIKYVGISTTELSDWMQPQYIRAQKRILIFDACNSGQAINDIEKSSAGFLAARGDENGAQIKAIDKLNERSGLYILSASASNQSAYELGRYSQGLLTYSLLKAIKQQPDILEDGEYLNVGRWFSAAEKNVSEMAREFGERQSPQVVTNTNFNIGVVDQEVMAMIVLPKEKALFGGCFFQNADENISADNLGLNMLTNQQLNEIANGGANAIISYIAGSNAPDVYTLSGRYTVRGNDISLKLLVRQNNENRGQPLVLTGTLDKLGELAKLAATAASSLVVNKK